MISKIKSILENHKIQNYAIFIAVVALMLTVCSVWPFATDGYEDIADRATLDQRIAYAIENHQDKIMIDYSGEDWESLKSWLKDDFRYPVLSQYTDEFSIYNYESAKFTYWTYDTKKRVKIVINYKLSVDETNAVNAFADDVINTNNLRNMTQYEAIKFVHDYLINNFGYNVNENSLYTMIQNGETNCYGYTMMNYVILSRLGVEVRTTTGIMNNSHIWNAVKLDGTWYYEDITWDTISKGTDYFLISTEKIQQSHKILGNFIPDCPSNYVVTDTDVTNPENPEGGGDVIIIETPMDEDDDDNTGGTGSAGDNSNQDTDADNPDDSKDIPDDKKDEEPTDPIFQEGQKGEVTIITPSPTPEPESTPDISKNEKIQKLNKLLKALKNLKKK